MTKQRQATLRFWRRRIDLLQRLGHADPLRSAIIRQSPEETAAGIERTRQLLAVWVPAGARVLDVGCGCGDLRTWLPEPASYLGLDLVPEFIAEAYRCYGKLPATRYKVVDLSVIGALAHLASDSFDYTLGRWVNATILSAVGMEQRDYLRRELLRIAPKSLWFSQQSVEPEIWERGPDGEPLLVHLEKD